MLALVKFLSKTYQSWCEAPVLGLEAPEQHGPVIPDRERGGGIWKHDYHHHQPTPLSPPSLSSPPPRSPLSPPWSWSPPPSSLSWWPGGERWRSFSSLLRHLLRVCPTTQATWQKPHLRGDQFFWKGVLGGGQAVSTVNVTFLARKEPYLGFLSLVLGGKPIELRIRALYLLTFSRRSAFFVTIVRRKRLRIFFWKFWWSWWLTSVGKYRGNKIGRGGAKAQHTPTNQSINQNFSKHFGNPLLTPMHC